MEILDHLMIALETLIDSSLAIGVIERFQLAPL